MTNIFLKIISGEIPAQILYQTEDLIVIKDIFPQAPVHLLVIPKRPVENILGLDGELAGKIIMAINEMARQHGLEKDGFRVVVNTGDQGGQTVPQVHFHLLGGREMKWPPG